MTEDRIDPLHGGPTFSSSADSSAWPGSSVLNKDSLSRRSLVRAGAVGAFLPLAGYSFDRDGSQRESESDDGSYGCRYLSAEGEAGVGHT